MELTATPSGLLATFSPSAASSPPPASSLAPDRPCRRTGRGLPGLPPSRAGKRLSTFLAAEGLAGCLPAARRCPSPRPSSPAARSERPEQGPRRHRAPPRAPTRHGANGRRGGAGAGRPELSGDWPSSNTRDDWPSLV